MDNKTILQRNPELLAVDMDGETVMMDMESGNYFGVNSVGSHIWEILETQNSIEAIVDSVQRTFEIEEGMDVQDDVLTFLNDMQEQKIIEVMHS